MADKEKQKDLDEFLIDNHNGLVITTKDGIQHKFITYERQKIAEIIEELKG